MKEFTIRCNQCGSNEHKIERSEELLEDEDYEEGFTDHWIHLICCHCGNKELIDSYTTT